MKRVGAFAAKTHFAQLLDDVEHNHQQIVIQRRGKDVAVISPSDMVMAKAHQENMQAVIEGFRALRTEIAARPCKDRTSIEDLIEEGRER